MAIKTTHVCLHCFAEAAPPAPSVPWLWRSVAAVVMILGLLDVRLAPLFLVGLIWLIWLVVTRNPTCPSCGKRQLISVSTPRGASLLSEVQSGN